jgi:hypothetical protein
MQTFMSSKTTTAEDLYFSSAEEIETWRQLIKKRDLLIYESIEETEPSCSEAHVNRLISQGWKKEGEVFDYGKPVPWDERNRSFSFRLHAWDPISLFLHAHSKGTHSGSFRIALRYVTDWLDRFEANDVKSLDEAVTSAIADGETTKAWYDMAAGLRIYRLAYLLDVTARLEEAESQVLFSRLFRSLIFHQEALSRDSIFRSHNNHGLYQALGQVAASRRFRYLPGFEAYHKLASERLEAMAGRMFFPSGLQAEHSPGYHYMVLGSFLGARASGLIESQHLSQTIENAEHAVSWMVEPDGSLPTIGDTDRKPGFGNPEVVARRISDKQAIFALSGGSAGDIFPLGVKTYQDAGFVFARFLAPESAGDIRTATHFSQIAAFHSRSHKHADHLSFTWSERGKRILIDPGKFAYLGKTSLRDPLSEQGYYYSDPRRIYVERTRAHNCVEIDHQDYRRKGVKPFGSALLYAGQQGDLGVTLCELRHPGQIRHFRAVIIAPGLFLLAIDWLKDGNGVPHDFHQWFQLAPEWGARFDGDVLKATHLEEPDFHICATSLISGPSPDEIRIGQMEPEMSGWSSDKQHSLVPSPSVNWHLSQQSTACFATVFATSKTLSVDRDSSSVNDSITAGQFRWSDDKGPRTLRFSRKSSGALISVALENGEDVQPPRPQKRFWPWLR